MHHESWINVDTSELLGEEQSAAQLAADPVAPLIRVMEVLMVDDFPKLRRPLNVKSAKTYSREECLEHGRWLAGLLQEHRPEESPPRLYQKYLYRLGSLGIGCGLYRVYSQFGSFKAFAAEVGATTTQTHPFATWNFDDYLAYHKKLTSHLGRRPRYTDYNKYAPVLGGPTFRTLWRGKIKIPHLNEHAGLIEARIMEPDDMVRWGVRVMLANPDRQFTPILVDSLSRAERGVAVKTVYKNFQSFRLFRERVSAEYEREIERQEDSDRYLCETYHKLSDEEKLKLPSELDRDKVLQITAKYLLVERLLPELDAEHIQRLARRKTVDMINAIQRIEPRLTPGHIEVVAEYLDILDYVWPNDDWRRRLRVTDQMYQASKSIWHGK
jgi:hypothetical protein